MQGRVWTRSLLPVLSMIASSAGFYWLLIRGQPEYERRHFAAKAPGCAASKGTAPREGEYRTAKPEKSRYFKSRKKVLVMRAGVGNQDAKPQENKLTQASVLYHFVE